MAKAGWGERIKERARELGMTDSAVARALGIAQRRYSAYANESREPDFLTLVRICRVLQTTPDAVLGFEQHGILDGGEAVTARLIATLSVMTPAEQLRTAAVVEALAAHPDAVSGQPTRRSRKPNKLAG